MTYQPSLSHGQQLEKLRQYQQQGFHLSYVPRRILAFYKAIVVASRGNQRHEVQLGHRLTQGQAQQLLNDARQFVSGQACMDTGTPDALAHLDPAAILQRSDPLELHGFLEQCRKVMQRLEDEGQHDAWRSVAGWINLAQARLIPVRGQN